MCENVSVRDAVFSKSWMTMVWCSDTLQARVVTVEAVGVAAAQLVLVGVESLICQYAGRKSPQLKH
jgi:Na+-transporting NADH:ubiquinone oxidoreductase subunit NqrB